ncbi:MAG: helix-turn-helix domain-containing protein [Candidatus Moraniibacteriota bacterium]
MNEKEAAIYLALLELGESNIGQLAKKSGVKRTTVYDVLEALKQKGLASQIKKSKKTLFSAEDPRSLEQTLDEKKHRLQVMLPELLSLANFLDNKPRIRFYEGTEGIKEVYKDTLRYPDLELLAWVAEEAIEAFDEKFLNDYYLPRRVEKKIWVRAIAPDVPYMQQYKGQDIPSLRKTRLLDAARFPLDVEINLYGRNKIGIMSFSEKIGLIIESERIFRTLESIFEAQWESLE